MPGLSGAKRRLKRSWLAWIATWRTLGSFRYDLTRYLAHSSTRDPHASRENLGSTLTARYHAVEKALALPEPRPGFGATLIPKVVFLVESYVQRFGEDDITRAAVGALAAYREFNLDCNLEPDQVPAWAGMNRLLEAYAGNPAGLSGVKRLRAEEVAAAVEPVGLDFFTTRHSTRIFEPTPVTDEEIDFAVLAARSAPAVCNREFSSVSVWTDADRIRQILDIQGGAAGFGHQIPALAMVTVSLTTFSSEAERNQAWIDGGLFAMAFILGLHAQAIGSVALNWSKAPATDQKMRALTGIEDDRSIIMFVGFGHLPDEFHVAASPRLPAEDFCVKNPPLSSR